MPLRSLGLHPFPIWWSVLPWTSSTQQELVSEPEAAELEGKLCREGPMRLQALRGPVMPAGEGTDSQPALCSLFPLLPPLVPLAPERVCVTAHLHCGIRIHKGRINCTLVNSSSTRIKIYIPIFSGLLVQGRDGRVSSGVERTHETVPLTVPG